MLQTDFKSRSEFLFGHWFQKHNVFLAHSVVSGSPWCSLVLGGSFLEQQMWGVLWSTRAVLRKIKMKKNIYIFLKLKPRVVWLLPAFQWSWTAKRSPAWRVSGCKLIFLDVCTITKQRCGGASTPSYLHKMQKLVRFWHVHGWSVHVLKREKPRKWQAALNNAP